MHGAAPRPAADAFSIELAVRDYELDQFGVVNNAVYANYAEHGAVALLTRNDVRQPREHLRPSSAACLLHPCSVIHCKCSPWILDLDMLRVARHEFLAHIGIDAHVIARDGDALALAEQTIRFLAPLRSR